MATSNSQSADWQSTKKTVLERSCHMFNNPFMSDIKFTCESSKKQFYAHKYVLGTSSAVFHAMFYGELAETKAIVHLSDTDEESFEQFLHFLYTDECNLTADNVMSVMYISKKYIVPSLTEKCVTILEDSLDPKNVLRILEQARHFDEAELEGKCLKLVESKIDEVVNSEAFTDISQNTLACILKQDDFNIPEVQLFQAVLKWCDKQCSNNKLEVSGKNRREMLQDAVYDIAFLSMSETDFAKSVHLSGLLSADEIASVYGKMNGIELPCSNWKKRRQNFTKIARFLSLNVKNPHTWWSYSGQPDELSFSVSRKVFFYGVHLFGDKNGSQYKVVLNVDGKELANDSFTSKIGEDGIAGYDVLLSSPVTVEKDKTVTISATISGPISCYGECGILNVEREGLTVSFYNANQEFTNGTSQSNGQFYKILISGI